MVTTITQFAAKKTYCKANKVNERGKVIRKQLNNESTFALLHPS